MSARRVAPEAPKTPEYTRLIQGPWVVIQVETSVFHLPRNLVEHYSQHLKERFQLQTSRLWQDIQQASNDVGNILSIFAPFWDFRQNRQPRTRLIYERADIFGVIIQWMWGGGALNSRAIAERSWNMSLLSPSDAAESMGSALCDLYFVASRLLIPELKADVLKQLKNLFSTAHAAMTPSLAERIFDKTTEISPLRKLLVMSLARSFRLPSGTPTRDFRHVFKRFPEFAMAMIDAGFGRD